MSHSEIVDESGHTLNDPAVTSTDSNISHIFTTIHGIDGIRSILQIEPLKSEWDDNILLTHMKRQVESFKNAAHPGCKNVCIRTAEGVGYAKNESRVDRELTVALADTSDIMINIPDKNFFAQAVSRRKAQLNVAATIDDASGLDERGAKRQRCGDSVGAVDPIDNSNDSYSNTHNTQQTEEVDEEVTNT